MPVVTERIVETREGNVVTRALVVTHRLTDAEIMRAVKARYAREEAQAVFEALPWWRRFFGRLFVSKAYLATMGWALLLICSLAGCSRSMECDLDAGFQPPSLKECGETFCGFSPGATIGINAQGYCECGCSSSIADPADGGPTFTAFETFETPWPPTQEFINTYLTQWEEICSTDTLEQP